LLGCGPRIEGTTNIRQYAVSVKVAGVEQGGLDNVVIRLESTLVVEGEVETDDVELEVDNEAEPEVVELLVDEMVPFGLTGTAALSKIGSEAAASC